MPTSYEPYDGDYIDADYTKLLNDVQIERGHDLGEYLEICVSLTDDDQLYILCSNDAGNEWEYSHTCPIPAGWDIEKVREMFSGYPVYLQTDSYQKPENAEEEQDDEDAQADGDHLFDDAEAGAGGQLAVVHGHGAGAATWRFQDGMAAILAVDVAAALFAVSDKILTGFTLLQILRHHPPRDPQKIHHRYNRRRIQPIRRFLR